MNCENKRNHWLHTIQTYVSSDKDKTTSSVEHPNRN